MHSIQLKPEDRNVRLKRKLFLHLIYSSLNRILAVPFEDVFRINCNNRPLEKTQDSLDIVTITFNNHSILELQADQLNRYLKGIDFTFFVADNSSDPVEQKKIEELCAKKHIGYFRIPQNRTLSKRGSYSHGAALNWVYYHFIKPRNARYFGFLDHDIFPTKDIDFKEKITAHRYYGRLRIDPVNFYFLWPGIAFWESSFLSDLRVNFMPCKIDDIYLDSGGSMWPVLFEKIPREQINMPPFYHIPLNALGFKEAHYVDFFDDCWFHAKYTGRKIDNLHIIREIIENYDYYRNMCSEKWLW